MKLYITLCFFILINCATTQRQNAGNAKDTLRKYRGELLETMFNVYDPSFLSYVWPKIKNGVHLSISGKCWDDISVFLKDLSEGHAWAYKGK